MESFLFHRLGIFLFMLKTAQKYRIRPKKKGKKNIPIGISRSSLLGHDAFQDRCSFPL